MLATALAGLPAKLGRFEQNGAMATFTERVTECLCTNATVTPAMSVPLHWSADGLPVGVHFAGRCGEEAALLQVAAQLETAEPWFERLPAFEKRGRSRTRGDRTEQEMWSPLDRSRRQ
jgi:amidase